LAASSFFLQTHFSFVVHFSRPLFLSDVIFAATAPTSSLVAMRGQGVLGISGESNNIRIRDVYSSFVDGRYVFRRFGQQRSACSSPRDGSKKTLNQWIKPAKAS